MKMKTELNHEITKTRRRKSLGAMVPLRLFASGSLIAQRIASWFPLPLFSLCALVPLWLSLILSCGSQTHLVSDKDWYNQKPLKIETVFGYTQYPILAEKADCVLIDKNGKKIWVYTDKNSIPPLPKTNQYGFCENIASVTNTINVYEFPDISSAVIDKIGKGMLVQVVEEGAYFVKISTPKIETMGWVYKKDLGDYMDWSKRNKPKVGIREDANAVYIGTVKIAKGISETHLDKNFAKNIATQAVPVNTKNISSYRATFENFVPYQPLLATVQNGGEIKWYERGKILEKLADGGCIIKKEFAGFIAGNSADAFLTRDIGGEAPMTYLKWEFYNSYGEKTGEWFGDAGEGKDKRYSFSMGSNYILIEDGMTYPNGTFTGHAYGFWDKYGRLVKAVNDDTKNGNIYYATLENPDMTDQSIRIKVFSIHQKEPVIQIFHSQRPSGYSFNISSGKGKYVTRENVVASESWNIGGNKWHVNFFDYTGKIVISDDYTR